MTEEEDALDEKFKKTIEAWLPADVHGNTEHLETDEESTPGLYFCGPTEHLEANEDEEASETGYALLAKDPEYRADAEARKRGRENGRARG